jgi:biotin carboxyl carrier protein
MKKLRITVNGTVYEALVEVLEDDEQYLPSSGLPASVPGPQALAPQPVAAPPPRPATVPAPSPSAAAADPNTIASPIAGTVQKVFVTAGARVEAKTPVVLLDAMKMDTYIYAPRGGEVAAVEVSPGDSVQVGDCLIRYRPEA